MRQAGALWRSSDRVLAAVVVLVIGLPACQPEIPPVTDDWDGDGTPDAEDCGPENPTVYASADDEFGDGLDQNCDGLDGVDADGDGCASEASGGNDCDDANPDLNCGDLDGDGWSSCEEDCDDADASVHPGAEELCGDGIDQDCADDLDAEVDHDGDGFSECEGDCDESDSLVNPAFVGWERGDTDWDCDGSAYNPLSRADASMRGESPGDLSGLALCAGGDVDGDGSDDLVVGSPAAGGYDRGSAYLLSGRQAGWPGTLQAADLEWRGEEDGDNAGEACAFGDLDGDGLHDIVIGAPGHGDGNWGKAYVVYGRGDSWPTELADADVAVGAESVGDQAGQAVASGGDVDGDGFDDIAIGAPFANGTGIDSGKVYVLMGRDQGTLPDNLGSADASVGGEAASSGAGCSLSIRGDVNGDGLDDLVVGADGLGGEDGAAYVLFGGESLAWQQTLDESDVRLPGHTGDRLGSALSTAGDVDGDGIADLVLGAPGGVQGDDGGAVYIVMGRVEGWPTSVWEADVVLEGATPYDYSGQSVAIVGDVDGDGVDDLAVGQPGNDDHVYGGGRSYVVLGRGAGWPVDLLGSDYIFYGEVQGGRAGQAIEAAGDLDADGLPDLVLGAPATEESLSEAGTTHILLSASRAP